MDTRKQDILHALAAFVAQRPGLDFANYGNVSAYRSESRSIIKDKHDFDTLLAAVSWRSISAEDLIAATRAYSGRLQIKEEENRKVTVDYCTGQYFPTEYRRAACAVLASALWEHVRTECMPEGKTLYRNPNGKGFISGGEWLRSYFRREFGARLAKRWFN